MKYLALLLLLAIASPAEAGLFNTVELRTAKTEAQWLEVLHKAPVPQGYGSVSLKEIGLINKRINSVPYKSDHALYGKEDYWATPDEFFKHGGDCEDYCIAKYYALRKAGVPVEDMRIVIVRFRQAAHAILTVRLGQETFILDNNTNRIRKASVFTYKPVVSMNENGRFIHINKG